MSNMQDQLWVVVRLSDEDHIVDVYEYDTMEEARESFDVDLGAPPEDEGDFISFEDLTAEQVTAWVTAAYPAHLMTRMHERLANRIAEQAAPAVVTMAPPWAEVQPA